MTIVAADGRPRVMRYRLWRAPTGISVRLVQDGADPEAGFEFAEFGDHDADVAELIDVVTGRAEVEMQHAYLVPDPHGRGLRLDDDEVVGRIASFDEDGVPSLVVDGRVVSWEELGAALSAYEGFQFRLRLTTSSGGPRH